MDKKELRQYCKAKRKELSQEEREKFSSTICDKLFSLDLKGNIMSYYPFNDEVDITIFNAAKYVSYPVISTDNNMDAYLPINNDFLKNYYGILEPNTDTAIKIEKKYISHIIVPCVGFDINHNRLGYGGGYYDRYLQDFKGKKIGIAFEKQKLDEMITDNHDIKLDLIITEDNIY